MGSKKPINDRVIQGFLADLEHGLDRCVENDRPHLLVAISGGADSTALLLGLHEISSRDDSRFSIEAAHFNHRLRGERSDDDEQFCRELCDRIGVNLHVDSGDVTTHAVASGESIEAAARELRYRFLAKTVFANRFTAVATGHTMDDQAETVLLAITRGAGLRGLSGITYASERHDLAKNGKPLRVVRPMLELRRSHTERFCDLNNVAPRQDESNEDLSFARNRVRHKVIPELQKINPGAVEAINRLAAITSEDVQLIDDLAQEALIESYADDAGGLYKDTLRKMAPALRAHVLAIAYKQAVGTLRNLDTASLRSASAAVEEMDTGSIDLPNSAKLVIEHDAVRFLLGDTDPGCPFPDAPGDHVLHLPGSIDFTGSGTLSARISSPAPDPASLSRWQAIINSDLLSNRQLRVRARLDGDRFHPFGMTNEVKLQDFFVNQHVPARWRDRVPLVLTDRGICWVVGERVAEWAKVPGDASEAILLEYAPTA